jgi:heme/copper-type cytochrome/quinol oxidase subunit 3
VSPDRRSPDRLTIDVSVLPETVFGHRGILWWATVGFIAIEATTLGITSAAYLYLRTNAAEWPPRPTANPDLLIPTINVLLLLLKLVPFTLAERAAKRFDLGGVRRWLVIGTAVAAVAVVLRWFELQALNVRWDTNAYGSGVWGVAIAHTTLLATDLLESIVLTAIFFTDRVQPRHFSDVEDTSLYERFLSVSWLLLYLLVFLGPRVL